MSELEKLIQAEMERIEEAQKAYQETNSAEQESSQPLNEADGAGNPTTLTEICKNLGFKTEGSMEGPEIKDIKDSDWNELFNAAKTKIGQVLASQAGSEANYKIKVDNFTKKNGLFKKSNKTSGYVMITAPSLQASKQPPAVLDVHDVAMIRPDDINVTVKDDDKPWLFTAEAARAFEQMFNRQQGLSGDLTIDSANSKKDASETKVGDYRIPIVKAYIAAKLAGGVAEDDLPIPGSKADKIYTDMLKQFANSIINRNPKPLFGNVYIDACLKYFNTNTETQSKLLEYAAAAVQINAYDSSNINNTDFGSTQLLMNPNFYKANANAKDAAQVLDAYKKLAQRDPNRLIAKSIILLPEGADSWSATLDADVANFLDNNDAAAKAAVEAKFNDMKFDTALVRNGQSAQNEMIKHIKDIAKEANKAPYGLVVNGTAYDAYKDTDNQWMTDEDAPIRLKVGDQVKVTKSGTVIDGVRLTSNDRYSDVKIVNNRVDSFKDGATEGNCVIYFLVDEGHRSASCYVTVVTSGGSGDGGDTSDGSGFDETDSGTSIEL